MAERALYGCAGPGTGRPESETPVTAGGSGRRRLGFENEGAGCGIATREKAEGKTKEGKNEKGRHPKVQPFHSPF
ncbi:hypothetical protein [Azospirillum argentinense]